MTHCHFIYVDGNFITEWLTDRPLQDWQKDSVRKIYAASMGIAPDGVELRGGKT